MRVLIIDEQILFAVGIRHLLESHDPKIQTSYVSDNSAAYQCIKSNHPPDLIFLNINDDKPKNTYDLISQLNKLNLIIPLIVVSANTSNEAAALAIENNASGFITKNCSRKVVIQAISSVLNGKVFISKPEQLSNDCNQESNLNVDKLITARQQEILHLLSLGLLNKQIASELDISANTVKAHLHSLFRSLDVNNRTAAVRYGHKFGLI